MASEVSNAAPATPTRARGGGGRGRGNGPQRTPRSNNNQDELERGGRRGGRGRGSGRGGNSNRASANRPNTTPNFPPPPLLPSEGIIGDRPTDGATKIQGDSRGKAPAKEEEAEDDTEVCFICASPVIHQAVSPCNHRTCHICALRLRALYKSKACAHCRVS